MVGWVKLRSGRVVERGDEYLLGKVAGIGVSPGQDSLLVGVCGSDNDGIAKFQI